MSDLPVDHEARARFRDEWDRNFAVSANAGSGKTTAISERLAAVALTPGGADLLRKTAVVTFTKKAAGQIGQRARNVLLRRLCERGRADLAPLDHLERAFFGTIHSFCLLLAQRHGQALGINLNPAVVAENDDALWEEFLEQEPMQFESLPPARLDAVLRHLPLDAIFGLAKSLDVATARRFLARVPAALRGPDEAVLQAILAAKPKQKRSAESLQRNQRAAQEWVRCFRDETGFLPLMKPDGKAAGIDDLFRRFFAPLKASLAEHAATLAAELAGRYRAWRFDRGVQTFADQVEAAMAVLQNPDTLEKIRGEGWRVILDEAQDTDPQQFAVLVEITRPPGAALATWPGGGGSGPRPGHFSMVGDGQQSIYGSRADLRNFQRHLRAFERGDGGDLLQFSVTFRTPRQVVSLLNATFPAAFGARRGHNLGLPPEEGVPPPLLQVPYEPLEAGPVNVDGQVWRLPLAPVEQKLGVDARLAAECRQIAHALRKGGPALVGASHWGELCVIAPRNSWLLVARKELEAAGLKTALQMRQNRNGANPAYAWIVGLLAALCDPLNAFEWMGVLREVFAVSDEQIAMALRAGEARIFQWDEPELYSEPLRGALATLKPFVERVDEEGVALEAFARELVAACDVPAKLRAIDPAGALETELERLLAEAAELGLTGTGPRQWLCELLGKIDEGRPAGKPTDDAINLLTAHSAKGLEWPAVLPIGLWRSIGQRTETGLRLVPDGAGDVRVYFDNESLPAETREARDRERLRELGRLLYVTLTRPRRTLVLPWNAAFATADEGSFAELWGADLDQLETLSPPLTEAKRGIAVSSVRAPRDEPAPPAQGELALLGDRPATLLPTRLLPHQLAHAPDFSRAARHESALDEPGPARTGEDPIDYGLWWHETMEFLPWAGGEESIDAHGERALAAAVAQGFGARAGEEWRRLRTSPAWADLRSPRWTRVAELSVFSPVRADAWIDGVVDFLLHDPKAGEVWVLDWKTNRRRSGENDATLLARLASAYTPQLVAYGNCVRSFFPGCSVRLLVFSTAAGFWTEVAES